ncbi:PadR family transcriptional regulator [Methyloferula stellata]|uniref:PadR family transcriptional regulator n=1 Tax=Methyloferula stellata TaxID=876270 RepID=UPI00037B2DB1|nr:PadR family transcriptional regulator [Methyloferula stellata]
MRFFNQFHHYEGHRGRDDQDRATCGPSGRGGERGFGEHAARRMHRAFGRHGHHGHGGGRMFEQGDLRFVVLKLIGEKPSYGYEIIKAIEDRLAGAYAPSPGVVYPTLTLLEELGYIKVQDTHGPRKLFAITPEGEAALEQNREIVDAIFARMAEINVRHGGQKAPQLVRAWENLKMAMNLRVARGPLTQAQIDAIAAVLDDAAKAIESK